ncbi:helix-turn-helix domain-containing protein [Bordetella sp. 2513F-2]
MSVKKLLDTIPDEWGPKFECDGAGLTITTTPNPPAEGEVLSYRAPAHCFIVHYTAQPERCLAVNSDSRVRGLASVGSLEILPKNSEVHAEWTQPKHNLLLAFSEERLLRLAGNEFDNETFELFIPHLGCIDTKALSYAMALRCEVQSQNIADKEAIDAWITLFGTHILRHHSTLSRLARTPARGGLSSRAWRQVNDYVLSNLTSVITLEKLARLVNISPGHFSRAFKQAVGVTPYQYVISARLQYARQLIITTPHSLEEIARESGFVNNSHLTSSMRRAWGVTPRELRREHRAKHFLGPVSNN